VKKEKHKKDPWPTKAAMEQIYVKQLWGRGGSKFYSGVGSNDPEITQPYVDVVIKFLDSFEASITVCDLGCGDFNVGKHLFQHAKEYIAVDIVQNLIDYNKENFKADNLEFRCLDISVDELPKGDCAIVRQVLQHLSNNEVVRIMNKLYAFKFVIVTEHWPCGKFIPNEEIISGQGIRIKKHSGLILTVPPFNFKVKRETKLLSIMLPGNKGCIHTVMYEIF
jgi:hypothetical protein